MCLAVPGKIVQIKLNAADGVDPALTRSGRIDFGGVLRDVSLAYTPEASEGDYVLVHVGFALSVIDEAEANKTLEYLRMIQEPDAAEAPDEP
ncbi:MAG: HypC/HybG/HupF family hydrogenase formation chaperone [Armatimonadetes bacterium]|nr:HypC/HybG/HupF family hydrogenase formation chaperone [Armatimonadota bacterium]